jgi:hypothetical protein
MNPEIEGSRYISIKVKRFGILETFSESSEDFKEPLITMKKTCIDFCLDQ